MSDYCELIDPNCKTCGGTGNDPGGLARCRDCALQYNRCVAQALLAMQRDAERYRALRNGGTLHVRGEWNGYLGDYCRLFGEQLDAAIDAAMKG